MGRTVWAVALGAAVAGTTIVKCLAPTEITLVITTDMPCASLDNVAVVIGPPGSLETLDPTAVTPACNGNDIGTLVVTPSGNTGPVGIAVIAGTHGSPDAPAESCRAQNYTNCVVARRSLLFVPHTPLTLPIELYGACENFPCMSEGATLRTCIVVGGQPQCVDAQIPDAGACTGTGMSCEPMGDGGAADTSPPPPQGDAGPPGMLDGLVAGGNSTCALLVTSSAKQWWCWGQNDQGQLSFDTGGAPVTTPQHASSLDDFLSVAVGINHGCGIDTKGQVECWGSNVSGQLGDGTYTSRVAPKVVQSAAFTAGSVAVGDEFSCAIDADVDGGAFTCWGDGGSGQLGIGAVTSTNTPAVMTPPFSVVWTGASFACATSAGALSCWGDNALGQVDQSDFVTSFNKPNGTGIEQVNLFALGSNHGCAASGTQLTCWGDNDSNQVSASDAGVVIGSPLSLSAAIAGATAGAHHTCILLKNSAADAGNVLCVGDNSYGQLGNAGVPVTTLTANAVSTHMNILAAGYEHTCSGSSVDNTIFCWGDNTAGQLGDGTTTQRSSPVVVSW